MASALIQAGKKLLRPVSSAARYDLAIDNGDGTVKRIQCKTGILRGGRITFRVYSMSGHRGTKAKTYKGQVDAFGVYCPQTRASYLLPMSAFAANAGAVGLRVSPARNGQMKRIRFANDYVIGDAS